MLQSLESIKSKISDQQHEFQQVLKEFEMQKQKFESRKQQVDDYLAKNDVLHLNVGGVHICTLRSTLTRIPGTIFHTLLATHEKLLLDRDGRIFLDYDPELFRLMLNQLREWSEVKSEEYCFEMPTTSSYDRQRFRNFLRELKFDEKCFDLQFYNATHQLVGKTVQNSQGHIGDPGAGQPYFYGSQIYSTGFHRIQVNISRDYLPIAPTVYMDGCWLGVINSTTNQPVSQSSLVCSPDAFRNQSAYNDVGYDDIFEIEIDCENQIVTARNQRTMKGRKNLLILKNAEKNVPLPWRFCVCFLGLPGPSIQIL